jgi:hypothetical protein
MAKISKHSASKRALRAYWKPKGVVDEKHAKLFRSWLQKHADGIDIATFIHSSAHEKKHANAQSALVRTPKVK